MAISKTQKWVVTGAACLGSLLGAAGIANAATTQSPTSTAPAAESQDASNNETTPTYTSSVTVPNTGAESTDDAAEAAQLKVVAVLTPDQAKAAALAAAPGTAGDVELSNENGNVVYSVEVTTAAGKVDVKVDAGNGSILAQETDNNDGEKDSGKESQDGSADQADGETNDATPTVTVP